MPGLSIRQAVLELGSCPVCPWLAQVETLQAIRALLQELLHASTFDEHGRSFVTPQAISTALDITAPQTKVLIDLLAAVVEPPDLVQRNDGDEVLGAEVYSLSLYLCAHFYLREAHKADASDVWPPDLLPWQAEPSSPLRMTAHSWGREQQGGHSHKAYLPSMRQHLQQHLQHQEALLSGFSGFVARHADVLLALVTAPGAPSPGKQPQAQGMVSAAELDRLSFLLKPREAEAGEGPAAAGPSSSSGSGGSGGGGRRKRRLPEGGSPMDVCPTPFTDDGVRISDVTPFFSSSDSPTALAPLEAVTAWLVDALQPPDDTSDLMVTSGSGGSPHAPSPQRQSVFNQLAAQMGVLGPQASPSDIQGVHKATVARGEDDFPSAGVRVLDCHDAVVYCLAPLQYALISACTDCVVVLGAVGRALRVERCERVQVIAVGRHVTINTCHDCILYLGVNQAPLLLGDNRFLQLAPYNSSYQRLAAHMGMAGVRPSPNLWDQPLALLPDHSRQHPQPHPHQQQHTAQAAGGEAAPPPGSPLLQWHAAAAAREREQRGGVGPPSPPSQQAQQAQQGQQGQQGGQLQAMELSHQAAAVAPVAVGSPAAASSPLAAGGHTTEEGLPSSPVLGGPPAVTVLPPGKLTPFVVPFKGGPGPMCGGPATINLGIRASSDSLSNFMAVGEGASGNFPISPFALPPAYAAAWQHKMQGAADVRAAVKAAELEEGKKKELMGAIQAHFKDWLQATGSMRQVYDLARAERDESAG
ncbi:hypothetical protein D9Q98_001561 [Chlorella vulgaris]|uniref:TBCC domain-containing protein 1 n=1 Tax=Chlorella vulgaris TaxID=3077 RepID=A0A9D4YZU6_CHLVU|nr:hypothetical protein D9Q98_001561 [Chlorella vulgaris]